MKRNKIIYITLIISIVFSCRNEAQVDINRYKKVFTENQLLEDFNILVEELEKHPAANQFISKEEWKKIVREQFYKIKDSMRIEDFHRICAPLVAKIGCGHTNIYNLQYNNDTKKTLIYLPYRFEIVDDKVFIIENLSTNKVIPLGSEVIAINGISITKIKDFILSTISADGYNLNYKTRMASKGFTYYYHTLFGINDKYQITYLSKAKRAVLKLSLSELIAAPNFKNKFNEEDPLSLKIYSNQDIAVIKIGTFSFYDKLDYFKNFIDRSFQKINDKKITNVIIDLRGNQGGDPYCSAYLLRAISDKSIVYYADDQNYPDLLKPQPPLNFNLKAKPYILIDGLGFSSTGHFAALVKYHDIGLFVGEELGSTYSCNAVQKNITLNNTKLFLQVAQKTVDVKVDPNLFSKKKGIIPDIEIKRTLNSILSENDETLNHVLKILNQSKTNK